MDPHELKPCKPVSNVQMLTRYKAWASTLTYKALMELPPGELTKKRQTHFGSVLLTLNHIHIIDEVFKAHILGKNHPYSSRKPDHSPAIEELWKASTAINRWYIKFTDSSRPDQLQKIVSFEFIDGGKGTMTQEEILLHLVNHATYHRGFISDMLQQVPASLPATDLPVFLRDVWRPAP